MIDTITINAGSAEKSAIPEELVRQMYELLGSNMIQIVGGEWPNWRSNAEFSRWKNEVFLGEVHDYTSHFLVIDAIGLRGFLSYTAPPHAEEVYLNEIQIRPSCRADGATLRRLVRLLLNRMRQAPQVRIRMHCNKVNSDANTLARKMGFEMIGQTDRGFRYEMKIKNLLDRIACKKR